MATESKYRPFNNIPPATALTSRENYATDTRQQRRHRLRLECREKLVAQYRRGRNTHQWPFEMPRRVQRRIVRRMAKQLIDRYGLRQAAPGCY